MELNRVTGLWRLALALPLAVTAWFSTTLYGAPGDCCGAASGGECVLDYPYTACEKNENCTNPNFPVCCAADGFCGSGS
jgi:hypothetical protein